MYFRGRSILFTTCINELHELLSEGIKILDANDLTFFFSNSPEEILQNKMISEWSNNQSLLFNIYKTNYICFHTYQNRKYISMQIIPK